MSLNNSERNDIIKANYNNVYKYCVSRCGNREDAQDIVHDVFLVFIQKADNLKNNNLSSWFYSTADLLIKEYFRKKQKNYRFLPYEECVELQTENIDDYSYTAEEFEKLLTDIQKKVFSILTEKEKEIFIKRFIEKKSIQIIAEELDITENNASVQVHRVKKKARKVIITTELIINIIIVKIF